jgi:hypothetical protein
MRRITPGAIGPKADRQIRRKSPSRQAAAGSKGVVCNSGSSLRSRKGGDEHPIGGRVVDQFNLPVAVLGHDGGELGEAFNF